MTIEGPTGTSGRPPSSTPVDRVRRHHLLFLLLLGAGGVVSMAMFVNNWLQRDWLAKKWLYRRPTALLSFGAFATISLGACAILAIAWRRGSWRSATYIPLRWLVPLLTAAWVSVWTISPPTLSYDAQWALAAAIASWSAAVVLVGSRPDRAWPRWFRVIDVTVCELAAVLVLAEVGLRLARSAVDSPFLATASSSPDVWLNANRLTPGKYFEGFRVNREGYVDVEPEEAARRSCRVVCIGDSFSVGVVPHEYHYTTVAERWFDDLEVYNAGVVDTGPREYLRMLEISALPLHPRLIVIALFIGNDLTDSERGAPTVLSTWMDRNEVLALEVPRRLLALAGERRAGALLGDASGASGVEGLTNGVAVPPAELEQRFPWLADPFRETPHLSQERFASIESTRAEVMCFALKESWDKEFGFMKRILDEARPIPVGFLLIPDEYQVEDGLWEDLRAQGVTGKVERDRPQRLLKAWLDEHRVPYVDLLPRLLAVEPLGDGRRHVYHLRDTHFNARGNRIAGAALAELIERCGVASRARTDGGPAPR